MDSGSITACKPICNRKATHAVTYRNGSYGPFRQEVCSSHVRTVQGRAYPSETTVEPI
jgi:hypothetical protein